MNETWDWSQWIIILAIFFGVSIFANICYARGGNNWHEKYNKARQDTRDASNLYSASLKRQSKLEDKLSAIWECAQESNIHTLWELIEDIHND